MITPDAVQSEADALLRPISEAQPAGENASYDANYDKIRTEVGKLDSPTGGEIDWEMVVGQGCSMLTTTSKDLLIACYTAYGLLKTRGLEGLAIGLAAIEGLFERYWETMFPPQKRARGRGNALGWLVGRLEIELPLQALDPSDRPAFELITTRYQSLAARARDQLDDHAPGMRGVSEVLTRIDLKLPKAAPAASPVAVPDAASPPSNAAPPPSDAAPPPSDAAPPPSDAAPPPSDAAPPPEPPASPADAPPPTPDRVAEAQQAATAWLEPLGDPPHGIDARYESAHETIRAEVAKLDSPSDSSEVDWDQVHRLSAEILRTQSKDLLVASYFAFAQLHTRGIEGLNEGLSVVSGLLEGFETLWPKRARGQGNALSWLCDQLERQLAAIKPTAPQRDCIQALQTIIKRFATAARETLEDNAPATRSLEQRLQRMLLSIPAPQPTPVAKPPPSTPTPTPTPNPTPAKSTSASMPAATADVGRVEDVGKYLLETGRAMTKAANLLRRAQPTDPTAYRLIRVGLWIHLATPPPAGPGGKTQIPPIPAPRRKQFGLMEANEKWSALLEETESALSQFRFCLDLQRMSALALQRLGKAYEPARNVLLGEVGALLRRMPGLPDQLAGDGSPLADEQTRAWIASEVMAPAGGGGGLGAIGNDPGEVFAKIGPMLKTGKTADAMKLAKETIDATSSPRLRFIRRMALAQACLESGQPKLARSMFAALDQQVRDDGLTEWEPALASRCLEGLLRAIRASAHKGSIYAAADAAFERLCHLDPIIAARLSG